MKRLLRSRAAAVIALLVLIPVSVCLGGWRSIRALAAKAETAYRADSARYGCAQTDVTKLCDLGGQLGAVAAAVLGEDSLAAAAESARRAAASPLGQEAVLAMYRHAALVYQTMQAASMSDQQARSATSYFYEMQSTVQRLAGNKEYADAAARYNRALSAFPGSLWGGAEAAVYPTT